MLENYQKAEVAHINEVIAGINSDIEKIDEKYRKLAEDEKKALVSARDAFNAALDFWNKLDKFPGTIETKTKEAEKEEEKVVDTIFPENNEEPEFDGVGFTIEDNIPPVEKEKSLDLGAMKQDDTVLEFEKETEEEASEKEEEEEDEDDADFKDMDVDW